MVFGLEKSVILGFGLRVCFGVCSGVWKEFDLEFGFRF